MAPAHLQGALSNIHMAPGHLQGALSQPQARRRALRVSLGSTRPTTRAARPVRHTKTNDVHLTSRSAQRRRSFPSPSTGKFSSLPSITISVTSCRIHAQLEITDYAQTRRRRTTRPRVPAGKTSRRRPTKAQRAAFIDSQERPPSVAVFQTYKEIGNLQMQRELTNQGF